MKELYINASESYAEEENVDLYERISTNLSNLLDAMKWSQKQFAASTGIGESTLSNYIGKGQRKVLPSIDYLVTLCKVDAFKEKGINFTVNDLLSKNFNPIKAVEMNEGNIQYTSEDLLGKSFTGNYICYLFDQSKPVNEQDAKLSRALRYGVISIYTVVDGITATRRNNVYAKFYKDTEIDEAKEFKDKLDAKFDEEFPTIDKRNDAINKLISSEKGVYSGELTFSGERAFISLSSKTHFDNALMVLYTSSKKADKYYIGGCGCITSVTHGDDRMPTAQKIIMSRYMLDCSKETISEHLSMASAPITPTTETIALSNLCTKLYTTNDLQTAVLDESDKFAIINNRLIQLIRNYIEKNICCVANVSKAEDKRVYDLIKSNK